MPSRQSQRVKIINFKDKTTGRNYYLMIGARTGFRDVWIGDTHYYYNYTNTYNDPADIDVNQVIQDYNDQENAKKTIVIRRR